MPEVNQLHRTTASCAQSRDDNKTNVEMFIENRHQFYPCLAGVASSNAHGQLIDSWMIVVRFTIWLYNSIINPDSCWLYLVIIYNMF